jgi:hypothetical protein
VAEEKLLCNKVMEDKGERRAGIKSYLKSNLKPYLDESCPKPRVFISFLGELGLGSFFGVPWSS